MPWLQIGRYVMCHSVKSLKTLSVDWSGEGLFYMALLVQGMIAFTPVTVRAVRN